MALSKPARLAKICWALLLLALVAAQYFAVAAAPAGAATNEKPIKGGEIIWGVKDSFRCYVLQSGDNLAPGCSIPPPGTITTEDPAEVYNPEKPPAQQIFRFPHRADSGKNFQPPSAQGGPAGEIVTEGGVHFKKTGHIDLKISKPRIVIDGEAGELWVHVLKQANQADQKTPAGMNEECLFATLDLAGKLTNSAGPVYSWAGVNVKPIASKVENGVEKSCPVKVFGRDYGVDNGLLDPVTFSIDTGGPRPVKSGHADWGVNKAFRDGVNGNSLTGSTQRSQEVSYKDGVFSFPAKAGGVFNPDVGTAGAEFNGSVHYANYLGQRDFRIENLKVELALSDGTLKGALWATVTKLIGGSGPPVLGEVKKVATLDLEDGPTTTWQGLEATTSWEAINVTLTDEGKQIFGNVVMDPLSVTLSSNAQESEEPSPTPSPTPTPTPSPSSGEGGGSGAQTQKEAAILGGHMDWGLKKSFRDYIKGSIAHGEMSTAEGAAVNSDGTVRFPAAKKGKVGAGAADAAAEFSGLVRFTGHNGQLDMKLSNPRVEINGAAGSLFADLSSKGQATEQDPNPQPKSWSGLRFADLNLSSAKPSSSGSTLTWNEIPASLTAEGAQAFSGFYQPGTQLDPVRMVLEVAGDVGAIAGGAAEQASALVSLDKNVVRPGEKLTVTAPGFLAGEQAEVWVHSNPVFVGSVTSDPAGRATHAFVVPSVPAGSHRVELKTISSEKSMFSSPFTVLAETGRAGRLPSTGMQTAEVFLFALAWLTAGAAMLGAGNYRLAGNGYLRFFTRAARNLSLALVICAVIVFLGGSAFGQEGSTAPSGTLSADGLSITDGTRTLTVSKASNVNEQGETLKVEGRGYGDPVDYKGIYIAFCVIPPTNQQPTPCLGGRDETGSNLHSHWITSNPPPNSNGLHKPYGPDGSFSVEMLVSPQISPTIDCRRIRCAVVTRNDHTRTSDRSQDLFIPVTFAPPPAAAQPPPPPPAAPAAPQAKTPAATPPAPPPAPAAPLDQALPAPAATVSPDGLSATDSVRVLSVSPAGDLDPSGQVLEVKGSGYDPSKRLLLALCVAPGPGKVPSQCSREGPLKISSAPAPGEIQLGPDGSFTASLKTSPVIDEATDCREVPCVVATFNDTDRPVDRSQDIFIPVSFSQPGAAEKLPESLATDGVASRGAGSVPAWTYAAGAGVALLVVVASFLFRRARRV